MSLLRCVLLLGALLAPMVHADEGALQKLNARLAPLSAMSAQFTQTVTDEKGKVLQTSQGTLTVNRGNRLRWETTAPYTYLIVTDGKVLWRYDKDLEQVTRQPFKGELASTPALILSGDPALIGTNYDVSWEQGSAGDRFQLTPKKKNALFRALGLQFTGNTVSQLVLQDNLGQRTEIHFANVSTSAPQSAKLYQFDPPPGADVIDEP